MKERKECGDINNYKVDLLPTLDLLIKILKVVVQLRLTILVLNTMVNTIDTMDQDCAISLTRIEKPGRASQATTEFSALVSFPVCLTQAMNVILSIITSAQISLIDRRRISSKSETGLDSINMDCIC